MSASPSVSVQGIPLQGELTFTTVARLWENSDALLAQGTDLVIDLQTVTRADSAGLALLMGLMRKAQQHGKSLKFANIPEKLLAIARVSGVASFLTQGV